MKIIRKYKWLLLILLIAGTLRLWKLGVVPPSPDWDEAALGYNAYSVLKTGRDEYGTWFPLSLRSFDDYKPPLYMYLTIPSVALFGLNTWSVRFPSVIIGISAIIGVYFLVLELLSLDSDGLSLSSEQKKHIATITSLLLAISPWHIQFSRIAFEANVGLAINIWAVFCFFAAIVSKKDKWLMLSAGLFGLGLYAYHSERIFLPILLIILAWTNKDALLKKKKSLVKAMVVGLLVAAPLVPVFLNKNTLTRLSGTSSLADQTGLLARSVGKLADDQASGNPWGVIFDNRRLVWAKTVVDGYLSHYSFRWLFLTGDNPRHHAPGMGLLYLWELPFILYGMFTTAKSGGKISKILWGWFWIAPLAASPTTELPHAIRSLVFLPTFQIFTAIGIFRLTDRIDHQKILLQRLIYVIFGIIIFFNILYYLHMYFVHTNPEFSEFWQYGYKQAVDYTESHKSQYKKIVVSTKLEQPYMFFLFFTKYDPRKYLDAGGTASGGFAEVRNRFDVYEFRPIHWEKENKDGSVLYVGSPKEISGQPLETVYYLDGSPAMIAATH